jgi:glucose-1-phosphate cytidylyltransferase
MKTVILCGGLGTRLSEETQLKPKPMVTVGGHPMLWHIMNIYGSHGFNEFVLALGYKSEVIKEYFLNYYSLDSDLSIDLKSGQVKHLRQSQRDWKVDLIDTGVGSMTGGRLHRLAPYLSQGGTFMVTYGDGVADIDVGKVLAFHRSHGKLATVTAVRPPARFGGMAFEGDRVVEFMEKPQTGEGWINGGYFVFEPGIFDYLSGDDTVLEGSPLENLAKDGQLMAFKHEGFWQCMDTIRDRHLLEDLWQRERAPWKNW